MSTASHTSHLAIAPHLPVLGISGWSGSGKTTLIEEALPLLRGRGLDVAVVKHDAHRVEVDRPGKDSDRFFQAGADVLLQSPQQEFFRTHGDGRDDLADVLRSLCRRYDLVLVEGRKTMPLPKVWLLGDDEDSPPDDVPGIIAALPRGAGRLDAFMPILNARLHEQWLAAPVFGCVLIGGKSTRMGTPKHLLEKNGRTWLERTIEQVQQVAVEVVIAGAGELPESVSNRIRLHDVPGVQGPMAGLLAAMRWAPEATWLVTACDQPDVSADALRWLLSARSPGVWATLPRSRADGPPEPLLAHYDFRAHAVLERSAARGDLGLVKIAQCEKAISPQVPASIAVAWRDVDTAAELAELPPAK